MRKQCHATMSKETLLSQLQESLNNPQYERWNTTSVDHILLSLEGNDDEKCQRLALEILEGFLVWYKNNKYDRYYPDHGLQAMYSYSCLENIYNAAKVCLSVKNEHSNQTIHDIIEEEIKKNGPNKMVPINTQKKNNDIPYIVAGIAIGGLLAGTLAKLLI